MGTNYYVETNRCSHCGRSDSLHIGKSSAGWCFGLRVYPDRDINDLRDWLHTLISDPIRDEYGQTVSYEAMLEIIQDRKWGGEWTANELSENHALPGPNGLARHNDRDRGVRAGAGTWDCIPYEFS